MPQTAARCGSAADDVHTCVVSGWTLRHRRPRRLYMRRRRPRTVAPPPTDAIHTPQTAAHCDYAAANSSHMRVVDDRPLQCPLPISTRLSPLCTSRGAVIHISRTTHPSVHNARLRLHTYVCAPYRRAHENEHRNHTIARRGATAQPMRDVDRQQPTPQIRTPRRVRRTHHATSEDVRSP